jgi:hypothetical protein
LAFSPHSPKKDGSENILVGEKPWDITEQAITRGPALEGGVVQTRATCAARLLNWRVLRGGERPASPGK